MELDYAVGQILDWLNLLGIAKNTFVFFTSDNGAALMSGVMGTTLTVSSLISQDFYLVSFPEPSTVSGAVTWCYLCSLSLLPLSLLFLSSPILLSIIPPPYLTLSLSLPSRWQ